VSAADAWFAGPVREVLERHGWQAEPVDDPEPTLRLRVQGRNAAWSVYVRALPDAGVLAVYSVFPIDTPPERRVAMACAVARANTGLQVGNFELDLDDGELLFKTAIALRGEPLTAALFAPLIEDNIAAMDDFFPVLGAVLYDMTPGGS
jgi:hypothetical protein